MVKKTRLLAEQGENPILNDKGKPFDAIRPKFNGNMASKHRENLG
jgi:hypothetical protein